jgi:hypothetical protein
MTANATDESTSVWLTTSDKQLLQEYRREVFGDDSPGLRHAIRHAVLTAREERGD